MTTAAYVRVSSASQDAALQHGAILKATRARDELPIATTRWYLDKASGKTMDRPELTRLRQDVRAGEIRKVYVFRLDRLTRSGVRDLLGLVEEFKAHGCEIVSLSDGFDLSGPAAEVVMAVLAWAAKIERQAINERISAARVRIAEKGGQWGRPRREISREVLEKVRALRSKGKTFRYLAAAFKIPRATLARALGQKLEPKPFRPAPIKKAGKKSRAPRAQ